MLNSVENVNRQFYRDEFFTKDEVKLIVEARMHDLNINPNKTFDSMHKILNDNFKNGKLKLQDFGFKDASIKVVSKILSRKD